MKRLFLKNLAAAAVMLSVGLLAGGCERENGGSNNEGDSILSLQKVSGASQNRIKHINFNQQAKVLQKNKRLTYVGTIAAPQDRADYNWSASSVAVGANGLAYVTWHSNVQAANPATVWGGAVDVVSTGADRFELVNTYLNYKMKVNHALVDNNRLFLSGTHSELGGAIARVSLNGGDLANTDAEHIGFPGASVNAVASYKGNLVAVSGYNKGTYAIFNSNVRAKAYNYVNSAKNEITPSTETIGEFGGKYVVATESHAYVLRDAEGGARIIDAESKEEVANVGVRLETAKGKQMEVYNDETKTWELSGDAQTYYGKHTMAVKGDFAYVACGKNGLRGLNLTSGEEVDTLGMLTTGVSIYEDFLFAATSMGLRVYKIDDKGELTLYAFEVESYDETTGAPTSDYNAETETDERHSANLTAYDPATGYIYIAYGQSGVRVYKFTETSEDDDTTEEPVEGEENGDVTDK